MKKSKSSKNTDFIQPVEDAEDGTFNQELKIKAGELSLSNNDFQNLLNSIDTGTIFLDRSFRVNLFSPAVRDIFNLLPADFGRPLSEISGKLEYQNLIQDAQEVLGNLQTLEREVRTVDGRVFLMQISPYRTTEDRISGVVITFVNITRRVEAEEAFNETARNLERQSRIFSTTLSSITDFAYILDREGRFVYSNQALLDLLGMPLEEIIGKNFFELNYPEELAARLHSQIQEVFDTGKTVRDETPFVSPLTGARGFYEYIFNPVAAADGSSVELIAGSTRDITERRAAEESIRFQAYLLDTVEQSVIATDLDGTVIYWNNFAQKLYGWTAAEAIGRSIMELTTPNSTQEQALEIMSQLRAGKSWNGEFQVRRKDGATFPAHVINSPINDGDEALIGIVGVSVDITDRKQIEDRLRRSESELRLVTDSIPSLISYVDKTERYRFVNAVYEDWFKQPREQIIGRRLEDVLGAAYPAVRENVRRALAGETVVFETKLDYPEESRFVLAQYVPDTADNGEVQGFYAHVTDIGEIKRAEEAMRESEERLRMVVESASDYAIMTVTPDNIVNSWNSGAEKIFGYRESEIVGRSGAILFTREDRRRAIPRKEIETARREGRAEDERWHVRKDGSLFFASGVMRPLKDAAAAGFVKIARDQTDRIQAEKLLLDREILQKLVGAQENERKRIARDLHDELGQQLTALRLKLEAAKKMCRDEEVCGKIDEIQFIAEQIDADVDFLAWDLRPTALDDLGLVAALTKYIKEWSRHSEIPADFHYSKLKDVRLAPEVETNLYRIAQEALNNVSKHSQAGQADVLLENRDGSVILIIEDNGVGFNVEDKLNSRKGIGLTGMRERAELIGGTLDIESTVKQGTTIFVRVPATSFAEQQ